MRRKLIEADVIECVLGLGPNLFYNSPMEACVVICRTAKPKARRRKILFINAVGEVTRERAQSFLTDDHIERIVNAYRGFKDEPGLTRVARVDEIREQDWSINISLYVVNTDHRRTEIRSSDGSLDEAFAAWLGGADTLRQSISAVLGKGIGHNPPLEASKLKVKMPAWLDRSKWQRLRFDQIAENIRDTGQPTPEDSATYIGLEHMDSGSLHVRRWGSEADLKGQKLQMRKGDILFAKRNAYLRRVAMAPHDGFFSAHGMILRAKPATVLPEFLPFLMMSDRFMNRAVEISVGSLSPTINWTTLQLQEFTLPPLDERRRLAEILWAVDEALCSLSNLTEKLNQGLIAERDGFFSVCSKEKRQRVDNLFDVQLGKMLSPKAKRGTSPLPYLGNKNVQWGHFDLTEVLQMDFSPDEFQKFHLKVGDLLVCEGGEVGRCAIWEGTIQDCCFQKALHRLRPLNSKITPEYMLEFMFWGREKGLFSSLTGHSTIAHLPAIKLKSIEVPLVGAFEQHEFAEKVSDYRSLLRAVATRYKDTVTLRGTFLDAIWGV